MSIPSIDTALIRSAYKELNAKFQDLNKQTRSINMKTVVKTALVFAALSLAFSGLFFGIAALAGIAYPVVTWTLKAVIVKAITAGIGITGLFLAMELFSESASKTHKEFSTKMKRGLKQIGNKHSNDIRCSLLGYYGEADSKYEDINLEGHGFFLKKIELDAYSVVEQRYIEIREEGFRRFRENQDRSIFSTIASMWRGSSASRSA